MAAPARWARRFVWWAVAPAVAVLLLTATAPDLAPAWEAHSGGGAPGTFVAQESSCRLRCTWRGTWTGESGSVRDDVTYGPGGPELSERSAVPAVDTEARRTVFPVGGGSAWLFVTGFVVGASVLLVVWLTSAVLALGGVLRERPRRPLS